METNSINSFLKEKETKIKIDDFSKKIKAIGHPERLKILLFIASKKKVCVGPIWECMGEKQPIISQHLKILKENKILMSIPEENRRYYQIIDPLAVEIINKIKNELENKYEK